MNINNSLINKHKMQNDNDKEQSFEYNPLPTEMGGGNSNMNWSISSNQENSIIHDSQVFQKQNEERDSNPASFDSNIQLKSIKSLHSFRVSHSDMNDDESTLLEKMNIPSTNKDLQIPTKSNQNKVNIGNIFDCSNTDNKSIIISELDIQISASNINTNVNNYNNDNKTNTNTNDNTNINTNTNSNTHYNTSIKSIKTISKVYPVASKKLYRINTVKSRKTKKIYHNINLSKTLSNTPKANKPKKESNLKYEQKHTNKLQTKSRPQLNQEKTLNKPKQHKTLSRSSCDSEKKGYDKNQIIYSSMKKLTNQISLFDLLFKTNDGRVSSLSKKQKSSINKIPNTPKTKQNIYYTGESTNSTANQEQTKKQFINHIPTTQSKKAINNGGYTLNQKEFLIVNKIKSQKETPNKQNDFCHVDTIIKREYSLNEKRNEKNISQSFRNVAIPNSRLTPKNNMSIHSNNLKPFLYSNIDLFHTHQSIIDNKIKSSASLSKKSKQIYTEQYFDIRSNIKSKEKNMKRDNENNVPKSYRNDIQIKNNSKNDKDNFKVNQVSNNNDPFQWQTPINKNQIVQMYKNNIKHITITPINGLKMKMAQLQQQREKKKYFHNKPNEISKAAQVIKIKNNEYFFHKLQHDY